MAFTLLPVTSSFLKDRPVPLLQDIVICHPVASHNSIYNSSGMDRVPTTDLFKVKNVGKNGRQLACCFGFRFSRGTRRY